ncbi:MAG: HAD family hydrolase [Clostridia bacterium]|nr:HAD family hydrolase [Clostridia bacterium]
MKDTVIFDLDGTLLDTLKDLTLGVNHALRLHGMPERTIDEIRGFIGNGVPTLVKRSVPENTPQDVLGQCIEDMRTYYSAHSTDNTKPYDGICELLEKLRKNGIKTAVVTNKLESVARDLCKEIFGDVFTCVIGDNGVDRRKPAPDNVFRALKELGSDASSAYYVGDSDVDMITAENAGIESIGVLWGFRGRETLTESGAMYIAENTDELFSIITKS